MKLLTATAALALAAASVAGNAQAQGFFIDGRIGQSDLDDFSGADEDTGFMVGAGWWFTPNFAVEGGYADLYDRNSVSVDGFYAGVKGRALFDKGDGSGFFVGGRGGAFAWDGEAGAFSDDGVDWYAGAFAGYQINPNVGVSLNFDRFDADNVDTDLLSAGIEYTF